MSTERPDLIPVLVDAAGRSGTTVLMQLLASSSAVLVEREYPYESRYLTYLMSWSRLLDGCPVAASNWESGAMLPGPPDELGGLPWRDLVPDPSGFAARCFRSAWRHFSEAAPQPVTHYIEKVPMWIGAAARELLPQTQVIHLLRDPRDVWLSIAAFNAKRGLPGFSRRKGQDDEEFFSGFVASQRTRLEPLVGGDLGTGSRLLRYEDLIADPGGTAPQLGSWLGLELDPAAVEVRCGEHLTSTDPAQSLGRWRREMPRAWRQRFTTELGDLLAGLGYGDR